jgi:hypothetical protein
MLLLAHGDQRDSRTGHTSEKLGDVRARRVPRWEPNDTGQMSAVVWGPVGTTRLCALVNDLCVCAPLART